MTHRVREAKQQGKFAFPADAIIGLMQDAEHFGTLDELIGRDNTLDPVLNILAGGGVDFATLLDRNAPQRDHIFPSSKLSAQGVADDRVNHFANMQLLGAINNILKTNNDPETAFKDYDPNVLASDEYLIPKELLRYDRYDDFLRERTRLIQERVKGYLADSQNA